MSPRPDWQAKVEALGLIWHSVGERPYWDESACYRFTAAEIATIEAATTELYRLFLAAGDHIITHDLFDAFGIHPAIRPAIKAAWDAEPPALNYGRFDLGWTGEGAPKLFEFNCDTPTSLLEAAVVQWAWKEEVCPGLDQYNSLHDRLVAKWRDIAPMITRGVHFAHLTDLAGEDQVTVAYLRDTAEEAGLLTKAVTMDAIGWRAADRRFVDQDNEVMATIYHLYPWEWLMSDDFAPMLIESLPTTRWIEPIWKMIWSNKAILPILWQLFPDHPNLLPTSDAPMGGNEVAKPKLAREGANVSIRRDGQVVAESGGDYGAEGWVYQALYPLRDFGAGYPVLGAWIVDGEPAGLGVREDGLITGNTARFVPHVIEE